MLFRSVRDAHRWGNLSSVVWRLCLRGHCCPATSCKPMFFYLCRLDSSCPRFQGKTLCVRTSKNNAIAVPDGVAFTDDDVAVNVNLSRVVHGVLQLTVEIHCCVLHCCTGGVTVVAVAANSFNTPLAATCLNLLFKGHITKIWIVNFVCFHVAFLKSPHAIC